MLVYFIFWHVSNGFFRVLVVNCVKFKKMGKSILKKLIIIREYKELEAALPKYMSVHVVKPYSWLVLTVIVPRGFYRRHRIQFLIDIPDDYKHSVSF